MKIIGNVYVVPGVVANPYLIVDADGLTVIDTGLPFCGDSMVSDDHGLQGSRPGITWDETRARASERKQAALGAQILCSGHGAVVMDAKGKFPV
jgi:hypothetical protein